MNITVTAFWDPSVTGKELPLGKLMNEAVKEAGVKRIHFDL
jgi:hypothetical protein